MLAYFRRGWTRRRATPISRWPMSRQHADTRRAAQAVREALLFKCDVLWAQLDALHHAYVLGGGIPPGCFVPAEETVG